MDQTSPISPGGSRKPNQPRFVRFAVMLGIVVALNLFILVARTLVFPLPQMENFCPASANAAPQSLPSCAAAGGSWIDLSDNSSPPLASTTADTGYCDLTAKCQPAYDAAMHQYNLYSFIFEIALGIVALVVGILPIGSSIVSAGLSYGGVLAFVIAAAQYWTDAGSLLRLCISVIALATLIYIGIKRFHD